MFRKAMVGMVGEYFLHIRASVINKYIIRVMDNNGR
jgi:hypothetical protein